MKKVAKVVKKSLKKAQDGIVQGPFTEKTAKYLDEKYPGTSMKYPGPYDAKTIKDMKDKVAQTYGATSWGRRSDLEKSLRQDEEKYIRSNPETMADDYNMYRKGGRVLNAKSFRRESVTNGLRTSRKYK